jgi:hypothetical protein
LAHVDVKTYYLQMCSHAKRCVGDGSDLDCRSWRHLDQTVASSG